MIAEVQHLPRTSVAEASLEQLLRQQLEQVPQRRRGHGGHCAFVAAANGYDGYWAERTLIDFLTTAAAGG